MNHFSSKGQRRRIVYQTTGSSSVPNLLSHPEDDMQKHFQAAWYDSSREVEE
jgi:hypothetical protein